MPFSHHIRAIGAEVAGEEARHAALVEDVQLPRGDGDEAGGDSLRAVGEFLSRGLFIWKREGEMEVAATRIALGAVDLDAAREAADFRDANLDARGAIDKAARVQPGGNVIKRREMWKLGPM